MEMITHRTKDTYPVFEFKIPLDVIEDVFTEAVEMAVTGDDDDKCREPAQTTHFDIDGNYINADLTFVSNYRSHKTKPHIAKLAKHIEELTEKVFLEHYGDNIKFKVFNCTVFMYKEGDGIPPHRHYPYAFSAATYIHAEEGSATMDMGEDLIFEPTPGRCLIFPSHLTHTVKATPGERIMITMDLVPEFEC